MVWIEELRLRTTVNKEKEAFDYLLGLTTKIEENCGIISANVYSHALLFNDFSFRMIWDTEHPEGNGSNAGNKLKEKLKRFGLVDHSAWTIRK